MAISGATQRAPRPIQDQNSPENKQQGTYENAFFVHTLIIAANREVSNMLASFYGFAHQRNFHEKTRMDFNFQYYARCSFDLIFSSVNRLACYEEGLPLIKPKLNTKACLRFPRKIRVPTRHGNVRPKNIRKKPGKRQVYPLVFRPRRNGENKRTHQSSPARWIPRVFI